MDHVRDTASASSPQGPARSRTITSESWERMKSEITTLYMEQGRSLPEVMQIMRERHGFTASYDFQTASYLVILTAARARRYKIQFQKWNMSKYAKSSVMEYIHRKAQSRLQEGKKTEFRISGEIIDPARIERWEKRNANLDLAPRRGKLVYSTTW